jgi:WD repeat-containing protein 11
LKKFDLIRLLTIQNITSIDWRPTTKKQEIEDYEQFYFITNDGNLNIYKVNNDGINPDIYKPKTFQSTITASIWKGENLICGDNSGGVTLLNLKSQKSKSFSTKNGIVKKIVISNDGNYFLVLFKSGIACVYDMQNQNKMGQSFSELKGNNIDWAVGNYPIISTLSGTLLVYDISLSSTNSNIIFKTLEEPIKTPSLLQVEHGVYLRSIMENEELKMVENEEIENSMLNEFGESINEKLQKSTLDDQIRNHLKNNLVENGLYEELCSEELKISEKCLLTSKYFGDKEGINFWTLAITFLKNFKNNKNIEIDKEEISLKKVDIFSELKKEEKKELKENTKISLDDLLNDEEIKDTKKDYEDKIAPLPGIIFYKFI